MIPVLSTDHERQQRVTCSLGNALWRPFIGRVALVVIGLALSADLLNAGQLSPTPRPRPTPHLRPTPHRHPTPTPTPSVTPTATPSATPTATPTATPSVTPTPTPTPPDNNFLTGLYSYYQMDEVSGDAIDIANGRSLLGNIPGTAPGIINTSRSFPGIGGFHSPSYYDFSPGANHFFTTFWAKAGTLDQVHDASFLGKYNATVSPPDAEWLVYIDAEFLKPKFNASLDGITASSVLATTAFANTTDWYFIAAGWDGTNIKISVNGGPYATTPFFGPVFSGTGIFFCIGSEGGAQHWIGLIDEVAVWIGRDDLTLSEVRQLYNDGAGLPFSSFH